MFLITSTQKAVSSFNINDTITGKLLFFSGDIIWMLWEWLLSLEDTFCFEKLREAPFTYIRKEYEMTDPEEWSLHNTYHRISWVGRNPQKSLGPTSGPTQDHLWESHCLPESVVQMLLQLRQVSCCDYLPGESFPVPNHPLGKETFPNIQPKPPLT